MCCQRKAKVGKFDSVKGFRGRGQKGVKGKRGRGTSMAVDVTRSCSQETCYRYRKEYDTLPGSDSIGRFALYIH